MKSKNTLILIGGIYLNHKPNSGETMKNQLFLKRFNELFERVIPIDTFRWNKHPFCLVKLFYTLLAHPKAKVIISASGSAKHLIHFLYKFPINKHTYFWVVGGNLADSIKKGFYNVKALNSLVYIPVQGTSMVRELKELGVKNAIYVPNSKPITYRPVISSHKQGQPYRFVFMSRIHPDKGIKEIIEASNRLDIEGFEGLYSIDFYGPKDKEYETEFDNIISQKKNLVYKGYLDLTNDAGYDLLSTYEIMLFPTYWHGEGFPGVVLDANIAGVPIIASDWNLNTEVIENNRTGIIIPAHDSMALYEAMKKVIIGEIDLFTMKNTCVDHVQQYDFRKVLSEELMKRLQLLD